MRGPLEAGPGRRWKICQTAILFSLALSAGGTALLCLLDGMGFTLVVGQMDSGHMIWCLLLVFLLALLAWGDGAIVMSTEGWVRGLMLTAALAAEGLDGDKLLRRTDGIIGRELRGRGSGGQDAFRFLGSLTCMGPVWRFDSVETLCPRIYQLQDAYGLAAPMLERIRAAARARGFSAVVCPDPEHTERIQHLLLPELGLAFVTSREGMVYDGAAYRRIRLDAMIAPAHLKRCRPHLRFVRRVEEALRQEGLDALREAKACHDALEALYHPHVDFDGVDRCVDRELERLEAAL